MNDIVSKIKRFVAVIESDYQLLDDGSEGIGRTVADMEELNLLAVDIWRWAMDHGYQQFLPTKPKVGFFATALYIPGRWIEIEESSQDGEPTSRRWYNLYRPLSWLDNIRTLGRLAQDPAIDYSRTYLRRSKRR